VQGLLLAKRIARRDCYRCALRRSIPLIGDSGKRRRARALNNRDDAARLRFVIASVRKTIRTDECKNELDCFVALRLAMTA